MRTLPRRVLPLLMVMIVALLVGCPDGDDGPDDDDNGDTGNQDQIQQQIDESRQAHQQYEELFVALEDGYTGPAHFVENPEGEGAMGIHLMNPSVEGIDHEEAPVLVYVLDENGQYELAALEWLAPTEEVEEAPVLFGETFDGPFEGHDGLPDRYELHAWFYEDNPDGQFARWNPAVEAPPYVDDLNALVEELDQYRDVDAATEAGYESTEECVVNPEDSSEAMGVHYVNQDVQGLDETEPHVLVYEPAEEGEQLVAAEWLAPTEEFEESPELFGQTFEGPFAHEGQPERYELHVWTHRPNPNGLFAQWNPAVECPDGGTEE